ncbi:putative SAM dependent methyltransferase [Colletotrichum truncatum]|uniref:SAM dependent methyltransferase n=1 Tax=Colletotrichum truncatum TaxID=5467 RepID=A0ACC3YXN2_COLTU|nr:putative SAM dependent methyltransferase [Colletotrichum truncatum]KAF6790967.1 putative SAM dependent methyltransferase [Colletotrichum truncatum]
MASAGDLKTTSLVESNRVFWDTNASTFFEQDWLKVLTEQLAQFLRTQAPNLGLRPRDASNPVRLLDYACASGGASWALAPFVDEILGIDVAPAIVVRFNECASRLGYEPSQAHAIVGDLTTDASLAAPESFDAAIISLALHHLDDPPDMLVRLTERLKPGGVLIAVEGVDVNEQPAAWDVQGAEHSHAHGAHHDTHAGHQHDVLKTTNHHVFGEAIFRKWFADAGCDDGKFVYIVNNEVSHVPEKVTGRPGGLKRKLVIAAATKSIRLADL